MQQIMKKVLRRWRPQVLMALMRLMPITHAFTGDNLYCRCAFPSNANVRKLSTALWVPPISQATRRMFGRSGVVSGGN